MNPHHFLVLAKPADLNESLNYLDRNEVVLNCNKTPTGLRAQARVGRGSSHSVTANFDEAGMLTQVVCTCRRAQLAAPCSHSLALVTQVMSEGHVRTAFSGPQPAVSTLPNKIIDRAEDLTDEMVMLYLTETQDKISLLGDDALRRKRGSWLKLHQELLNGLTILSTRAMQAQQRSDYSLAFVASITVLVELSHVSLAAWDAMPKMAELTLAIHHTYMLAFMALAPQSQASLLPMVTTAYTHFEHRKAAGRREYMVHPGHYLFLIGNSGFATEDFDWLYAQAVVQIPALLKARPGLANGLIKSVAGGLLRHDRLKEAISMTKLGNNPKEIVAGVRVALEGQGVKVDFGRYEAGV